MLLQLAYVFDISFVHTLLHHSPNSIVNQIKIKSVRRPQIWREEAEEFWRFLLEGLFLVRDGSAFHNGSTLNWVCSLSAACTVRLRHTSPTSFTVWRTSSPDNGCARRQPWPASFRGHVTRRSATGRSVPPHAVSGTTCHTPSPRRPASTSFDVV